MSVETHPEAGPRPGGYAELAAEIRRLGLMDPRPVFYTGLLTAILGADRLRDRVAAPTWVVVGTPPRAGLLSAQLGVYGHDATHRRRS